jgi:hypothetical protein
MEFVIQVLQQFFDKTEERAYAIMLKVHIDGEGVCGVYSFDVAQTKRNEIAPPMRDDNSKNKAIITPKNIFLPKVASLSDPKINNIESSNIATKLYKTEQWKKHALNQQNQNLKNPVGFRYCC